MVDAQSVEYEQLSTARVLSPLQPRKLAKVPFVELADGRLQGVVSSGSDIARVYVSSIAAGTHDFSCGTNNNRPCGGAGGSFMCKHLRALADEAVLQYGMERVARYLKVEPGEHTDSGSGLVSQMTGDNSPKQGAEVFSRFLHHLSYLELPVVTAPVPELHWFPAMGADA